MSQEGAVKRGERLEWVTIGHQPLDPLRHYHTWSQEEKKSQKSKAAPIQHNNIMMAINTLKVNVPKENVWTRFHSTRPLTVKLEGPVLPFLMRLSLRSDAASTCHDAMLQLVDGAALKVVGLIWHQERLTRQPLAQVMEQTFKSASFCDWGQAPRRRF